MRPEDRARFGARRAVLRDGEAVAVRPLEPADGEALGAFYEGIPKEDFRFYCPHPLTRGKALENAAEADNPCQVVLVAEAGGGRVSGYAWYRWSGPDAAESHFGICIARSHQGRGLARALMERLMEIAAAVGPRRMRLTVQKANARAFALYRSFGFEVVREQMRGAGSCNPFPPEPEYLMEKRLPGAGETRA